MAVTVTHRLNSNSAFAERLKDAALPKVQRRLAEIGEDAVERAEDIIQAETNFGGTSYRRRVEGEAHLQGSIFYTIEGDEFPLTIILGSKARASKVNPVNYGARPHEITAKRKPMLVFPDSRNGSKVEVKRVDHPGVERPRNFLRGALDAAVSAGLRFARGG